MFYISIIMETLSASDLLAALGHESRLGVFRLLVEAGPEGMNPSAIGDRLALPGPTLSFHLSHLSRVGLITRRQESRFIFYAANYEAMDELIAFLTANCCSGTNCLPKTAGVDTAAKRRAKAQTNCAPATFHQGVNMTDRSYNVLFLCTGNSARSILAEAILNQMGKGRFRAYSAGSHPAGTVNRFALELLSAQGLAVSDLRSKSWDEFAQPTAPMMDFVFTVCDSAAGEVCPVWPGQPMTAHWGIPDPAAVRSDDKAARKAISEAFRQLYQRISLFLNLPLATLDTVAIQREINAIGTLDATQLQTTPETQS